MAIVANTNALNYGELEYHFELSKEEVDYYLNLGLSVEEIKQLQRDKYQATVH